MHVLPKSQEIVTTYQRPWLIRFVS